MENPVSSPFYKASIQCFASIGWLDRSYGEHSQYLVR